MSSTTTEMITSPSLSIPADSEAARPDRSAPEYPQRRRFTVSEFQKMAEVGILNDEERVELIDGEIITMARVGSPHSGTINKLNRLFSTFLGTRASLCIQNPVVLGENVEPLPDVVLARPREDDYQASHPTAEDVYLLVEVMDSSAVNDRTVKLPLYAKAGIREVWLVDLNAKFVEVHRRPLQGQYASKEIMLPGQSVSPEAFPEFSLSVEEILGRIIEA